MIKYIANEPSAGLYHIQQHVRTAVPNAVSLCNIVTDKSRDTVLRTEDLEDSITMVKSMKECGSPIADEMISDIKHCLAIMSTRRPRRGGLILNTSPRRSRSSGSLLSSNHAADSESSGYFSSVLKLAKQRASSIKWAQFDFKEQKSESGKEDRLHQPTVPLPAASASSTSSRELPILNGPEEEVSSAVKTGKDDHNILERAHCDEVKAGKETNLKAWLGDMDGNAAAERI